MAGCRNDLLIKNICGVYEELAKFRYGNLPNFFHFVMENKGKL